MLLPLIAGAVGSGIGAAARYGGARAQANALMPDEYRRRLEELRALEEAGQMGLSGAERGMLEGDFASQRGAMMADAQARQLAQAQAMAGGSPMTGRDFFQQELAAQQAQGQLMDAQSRQLRQADLAAQAQNEQMLLELSQRDADARAAKRAAGFTLAGDLVGLGSQTGLAAYGMGQLDKEQRDLLTDSALYADAGEMELAHEREDMARRARLAAGRMFIEMSGAYGPTPDYLTSWADPVPPAEEDEDVE